MRTGWGGVPALAGLRNELGQAHVRLGICAFMAAYFSAIGFTTHPLYLWFVLYCLGYLVLLRRAHGFSTMRALAALVLDNFFTIGGLHVTGTQGVFLYIFLIHISFGYGVRYGRRYLWSSVFVACCGVVSLYLGASPWRGDVHTLIAFFIGVPFIALYIDYFVTRLRRAQVESEAHAAELDRLLAFVAHDIRTPLQSLLTTIELARSSNPEVHTRVRLRRIERAVKLLGYMTTQILQRRVRPAAATPSNEQVTVYRWIVGLLSIFSDEISRLRIGLRYDFDLHIPALLKLDYHAGERLLLNALSNAIRHARDGELALIVAGIPPRSPTRLAITVENTGGVGEQEHSGAGTYHGAGLGLIASAAIADAIGGSFRFDENADGARHRCCIELPCAESDSIGEAPLGLPALAIGLSTVRLERLRSGLDGCASVLALESLAGIRQCATRVRHDAVAVFIDAGELARAAAQPELNLLLGEIGPYAAAGTTLESLPALSTRPMLVLAADADNTELQNALHAMYAAREIDEGPARTLGTGGLSGARILLVEDNLANVAVLRAACMPAAIRLLHAESLESARELLQGESFDAVILDWHLGDSTAAALLTYLPADPTARKPVWLILSSESRDEISRHIPAGVDCQILQRPVSLEMLESALTQTLAGNVPKARSESGRYEFEQPVLSFDLYEELRATGTPETRVQALLDGFKNAMDRALTRLEQISRDGGDARQALHAVKSIGESAGALKLGEIALSLLTSVDENGRLGRRDAARPLADAWQCTQRNIGLYEMCLGTAHADGPSSR